ncbi:MAG: molybdopterin cofactor-binding domain-containing protein, partial [Halobacteriales archaeon]|nr:molybdopterin cofactor-binding domain-containing protein [Halobacteriales archaeon]
LAQRAADAVRVEYERLEPVIDGEEAYRKDPPAVLHPNLRDYETSEVLPPIFVDGRPNVYQHYSVRHGDADAAFEQADRVYEDEYRTAPIDHVCMEPHVAVARPEGNGGLTIWTSCQAVHKIKNWTARILDMPPTKLRMIEPYVGGGFGGKESPLLEPVVGKLAELTGRPVKLLHTREEEFKNGMISGEFRTRVKTGVTEDGDIVAREVEAICPGGGYTSTGYMVARNATFAVANSYSISNVTIDTYGVYTNTPVSGSFRGFGNRQLMFPLESQLDDIARDLGLDPIAFRRQNVLEEGEVTAFNERRTHVVSRKCLDVAAERLGSNPYGPRDDGDGWV